MLLAFAVEQATGPGWTDIIGPYGATAALIVGVVWLVRDRARLIADRDAERDRNTALTERLLSQTEKSIPLLERVATALDRRDRGT